MQRERQTRQIHICYDGSNDAERAVHAAAALFGPRRAVVLDVAPSMTFAEGMAATSSLVPDRAFEDLNTADARRQLVAARNADVAAVWHSRRARLVVQLTTTERR